MHLLIKNMHAWVLRQLRPALVKRLAQHRTDGGYLKLQSAIPPSPIRTRFEIPEIVALRSEKVPRGRDINTAAPRAASESPTPSRNQRRADSPPVESQLAGLSISDDEGNGGLDHSAAEDSGIGGISSDEDSDEFDRKDWYKFPEFSDEDRSRVARKIICRQMDPQKGCREGAGDYLLEYCDSMGHRRLTGRRVGMSHVKLRDEYFARHKVRRRGN